MAGYHYQGNVQPQWQQRVQYGGQLPGYAPQQSGYEQQQFRSSAPQAGFQQKQQAYSNSQAYHERSSTPNPRPSKRMRGEPEPPLQGQLQEQQQRLPPQQVPQQRQQQQQQQQRQQPPPPQQQQQPPPQHRQQPPPPQQYQTQQQKQPQQQQAAAELGSRLPRSNNSNPAVAAWLDKLQDQIAALAEQIAPSPSEQQRRHACLENFRSVAAQSLLEYAHQMRVALFGSGASGLALHSSDLDVVITGLVQGDGSGGFSAADKDFVVSCLRRLERSAAWGLGRSQLGVVSSRLIKFARVPVLKLQLEGGLELDVSLNDDGGINAARFLQSFQQVYTAVQPLTLLLKCLLKQRSLAEVYMGGLGSWSLANMVIAHLKMMDCDGEQVNHLGSALLSFLRRYGVSFNRNQHAVAVKLGGVVERRQLGSGFAGMGKLALQDPLTGREVAGGSHRYTEVEELFKKLHQRLADALEDVQQGNGGSNGTVATNSQARSSRGGSSNSSSSHRKFGDEDDEWGYDAGNRSPTYQAGIRQRRGNAAGCEPSQFGLLEMLLDCRGALDRAGSSQAAAGAAVEQNGSSRGGQAGQWQWGDGRAGTSGAGASRKREWWQR